MKKSFFIYGIASAMLIGCSQDFDEKYEDNLEELTQEADDIKLSVDKRFNESAEADKILRPKDQVAIESKATQSIKNK